MASTPFQIALEAAAAASRRFNGLPHDLERTAPDQHRVEMESFFAASSYADMATPTTWSEFTQLLEHMTDEGLSSIDDDNAARLLMHARRLNTAGKTA